MLQREKGHPHRAGRRRRDGHRARRHVGVALACGLALLAGLFARGAEAQDCEWPPDCWADFGQVTGANTLPLAELTPTRFGELFRQWLNDTPACLTIALKPATPVTVLLEPGPHSLFFRYVNSLPFLGLIRGPPQFMNISFIQMGSAAYPAPSTLQQVATYRAPFPSAVGAPTSGPLIHAISRDANGLLATGTTMKLGALFANVPENANASTNSPRGPLHPRTHLLLFYRPTLLQRFNIDPASLSTWDALLAAAEVLHGQDFDGDGQGDWAMCLDLAPGCGKASALWASIGASIVQTKGLDHGTYFDPATMKSLLLEGAAAAEVARVFRRLVAFTQPDAQMSCNISNNAFTHQAPSRCAMTIEWDMASTLMAPGARAPKSATWDVVPNATIWNAMLPNSSLLDAFGLRGRQPPPAAQALPFAAQLLPGSAVVLDRLADRLVPCTARPGDAGPVCPMARSEPALQPPPGGTQSNGGGAPPLRPTVATQLVNRAPFSFLAWVAMDICDTCSMPGSEMYKSISNFGVSLSSNAGNIPTAPSFFNDRDSILRRALAAWQAATRSSTHPQWSALDALQQVAQQAPQTAPLRFMAAMDSLPRDLLLQLLPTFLQARLHPNAAPSLAAPLVALVHAIMEELAGSLAAGGDVGAALNLASARQSMVVESWTPPGAFQAQYQQSINYTAPAPPDDDSGLSHDSKVLLAVLVPVAALLLAGAALGAAVWVHRRRAALQQQLGPGAGAETTLLVARVGGYDALVDSLGPEVMESSLQVLKACVRELLPRFNGRETSLMLASEPSMLLLVFYTPADAVGFALAFQIALNGQAWPAALLEHPEAGEVWIARPTGRTLCGSLEDWTQEASATAAGVMPRGGKPTKSGKLALLSMPSWGTHGDKAPQPDVISPFTAWRTFRDTLPAEAAATRLHADDLSTSPRATAGATSPTEGRMRVTFQATSRLVAMSSAFPSQASLGSHASSATSVEEPGQSPGRIMVACDAGDPMAPVGGQQAGDTTPDVSGPADSAPAASREGTAGLPILPLISAPSPARPPRVPAAATPQSPHSPVARARQFGIRSVSMSDAAGRSKEMATVEPDGEAAPGTHRGSDGRSEGTAAAAPAAAVVARRTLMLTPSVSVPGSLMHRSSRGITAERAGTVAGSMGGEAGSAFTDVQTLEVAGLEGTFLDELVRMYGVARPRPVSASDVLVLRGLRCSLGLDSGVSADEVHQDMKLQTLSYSGRALQMAHTLAKAACSGMVLLSTGTFKLLSPHLSSLSATGLLAMYMGDHTLHDTTLSMHSQPLYTLVSREVEARLPLLPSINAATCTALGNLSAPLGTPTIAFMCVNAWSTLVACLGQVAAECLATFQQVAVRTSARHAGFVVECTEGLIVAAFDEPAAAALWALSVHHELLHMDWPPELLRHQLCEEVLMWDADLSRVSLVHKGLRLRTGLHVGRVECHVNSRSGRLAYRGRVMNRAARIASKAQEGQVLVSRDVLGGMSPADLESFTVELSGTYALKGVSELIECYTLTLAPALRLRRLNSAHGSHEGTKPDSGAAQP